MNYQYKTDDKLDYYGTDINVIHFKFGNAWKGYNFTPAFEKKHPRFCEEYRKYFEGKGDLFKDPLTIVNYIDTYKLPVHLYSNYVDEEFANANEAKKWICNEYSGGENREKLYQLNDGYYIGLDGEKAKW